MYDRASPSPFLFPLWKEVEGRADAYTHRIVRGFSRGYFDFNFSQIVELYCSRLSHNYGVIRVYALVS